MVVARQSGLADEIEQHCSQVWISISKIKINYICSLFHGDNSFTRLNYVANGPCFYLDNYVIMISFDHAASGIIHTFMNLYKLRGLVCEFRRPVVAYLALPCSSGNELVLELVAETNGSDVVPVR